MILIQSLDMPRLIQRVEYLHFHTEQKLACIVPFFNPYFDKKGKNWHYLCLINENKLVEIDANNSDIDEILTKYVNIGDQIFEGDLKDNKYYLGAFIGLLGYSLLAYMMY